MITDLLAAQPNAFEPGDTDWVLSCTALVLFMTPGLAFFYGGMVGIRNVLTMFSFILTFVIAWVIERTIGLRVNPADEDDLDRVQQGSSAYDFVGLAKVLSQKQE